MEGWARLAVEVPVLAAARELQKQQEAPCAPRGACLGSLRRHRWLESRMGRDQSDAEDQGMV